MKPRIKLAQSQTGEGATISLYQHDGDYSISLNGQELMHSKLNYSECAMGDLGVEHLLPQAKARILIGGLGLGFTLASVFKKTDANTSIEVVELLPAIIDWNLEFLTSLNGKLLTQDRVSVHPLDVVTYIQNAPPESYDAILLDIDNGPTALVMKSNNSLYSNPGLRSIHQALKSNGRAVFWSAGPDQPFEARLRKNGFKTKAIPTKTHPGAKRAAYFLYQADKST